MTTPSDWEFDAVVVGGGPGGSSTATALARRGRRVLLLERDRFPRFHIGESQLPWINGVLEELGAHDTIAKAGFVEKWGASFWEIDGTPASYVDFTAAVESPVPQTFQVPRARWDELLLRHAEQSGVIVREGHRAVDAAFEPDGVTLRYAGPDGVEQTTRVAAIVDASGRAGLPGPQARPLRARPHAAADRGARPVRGRPARRGPPGRRHPRAHAARRRVARLISISER